MMMPSRSLLMMASSDDSMMAASRCDARCVCVRSTANATCAAMRLASSTSSFCSSRGRSKYSMNFPMTPDAPSRGTNAMPAMPSVRKVSRNGASPASCVTSGTTIVDACLLLGDHGVWPSTALRYAADKPRQALNRMTPSASKRRMDPRVTWRPAESASRAGSKI